MDLTSLPEEILLTIVRSLDSYSQERLYSAYERVRDLISSNPVIKVCDLSMNRMATVQTLRCDFFRDISENLRELNMNGMPDIDKSSFMSAMHQLKRLETLEILYTNLTLMDMPDIQEACPTLRNISIMYKFGAVDVDGDMDAMARCQRAFENFKNVHFVGSIYTLWSKYERSFYILQNAKLNSLKYTIREREFLDDPGDTVACSKVPDFNEFIISLSHWKQYRNYGHLIDVPVLDTLDLNEYNTIIIVMEMIIISPKKQYFHGRSVYASAVFHSFLKETFDVQAKSIAEVTLRGDVTMMLWRKQTIEFNGEFFGELKRKVKQYLPYYFTTHSTTPAPKDFDWFCTVPQQHNVLPIELFHPGPLPSHGGMNHILNYDTIFKNNSSVQLTLFLPSPLLGVTTLPADCEYLNKLTFLSVSGEVVFSSDFFDVLFRRCKRLVTLNVHAPNNSVVTSIIGSISHTRSLKNFRCVVPKILDYKELFSSLSGCTTLENLHILEETNKNGINLTILKPLRVLIERCKNLYSLYIDATINIPSHRVKILKTLDKTKEILNRHYLCVTLSSRLNCRKYDIFMDVFNLRSITKLSWAQGIDTEDL